MIKISKNINRGVFFIAYLIYKNPIKQTGGRFWLLFFRGFVGFVALLAFFYNIANIPLAEAMTFSKTSPIFTAIFAYLFLKEKISSRGWFSILYRFYWCSFDYKPNWYAN